MGINWSLDWIKPQLELSYQKVAPTVTYQDIAISILLDITSKNQKVIDSAAITDFIETELIRPVFDEITLSDSVIKYVIKDHLNETVPLTDVLNTANQFLRDVFDEARAQDLEFPARIPSALLNEGLVNEFLLNGSGSNITDQVAVITPTKSDEIDFTSIAEILTSATSKVLSDTATISEGIVNNISKSLTSGFTLDDFADVDKSVTGVKGNIATMSDSISITLILSRMVGSTTINEITLN